MFVAAVAVCCCGCCFCCVLVLCCSVAESAPGHAHSSPPPGTVSGPVVHTQLPPACAAPAGMCCVDRHRPRGPEGHAALWRSRRTPANQQVIPCLSAASLFVCGGQFSVAAALFGGSALLFCCSPCVLVVSCCSRCRCRRWLWLSLLLPWLLLVRKVLVRVLLSLLLLLLLWLLLCARVSSP